MFFVNYFDLQIYNCFQLSFYNLQVLMPKKVIDSTAYGCEAETNSEKTTEATKKIRLKITSYSSK